MTYTPFIWLLLISALINGGLAYYMRHYEDVPSVKPFRFMMWSAAAWASLYGLSTVITHFSLKLFVINLVYVPALLTTIAALVLALEYTGYGGRLSRRRLAVLLILPAIFMALAFTSHLHTLWRYDYQFTWSGSMPVILATRGAGYWLYIAYMMGVSLAAIMILVASLGDRNLYFRSTVLLAVGILTPIAAGTSYIFDITPIRGFDWTSTSFIWTGLLFVWAVRHGRLFDVTPLARNILIEQIEDLMIVLNREGLICDFNRAARDALALSPATIGRSPLNLTEPWSSVFRGHSETIIGWSEVIASGRTYELSVTPLQDETSRLRGRIFLFRDVSQRKKVEINETNQRALAEALRETSQALSSTLDYNEVLVAILRNVGRVVPTDSANIALLDNTGMLHYDHFYGYENYKISVEELSEVKFSLSSSPIFKQVYETGDPLIIPDTNTHSGWIVTKSGAWIRSYAVMPIRIKEKVLGFLNLDSAVQGMYTAEHLENLRAFAGQAAIAVENARLFAALQTEVTERKQVEERLRQLLRAVEQSPASIVITDMAGRIEYVNPRFTEVTGFGSDEIIGQNPRILQSGLTRPETYTQLWEVILSGGEWRGEFINRRKNGEVYYESATVSPIIDPEGNVTHYLAVKEDVTEQKRAQEILRFQNERLNALHNITLDLMKRYRVEDVLDVILLRAADLLESPFGLLDAIEDDMLVVKATTEMTSSLKDVRLSLAEARLSAMAVETRQPQVVQDYSSWADRLQRHDAFRLKAVLNIPIMIGRNVVGVVALGRTLPDKPYTDEEIEVMKSFAQLAALAIDNAQLFDTAQKELAEKVRAEGELRNANQRLQFQLEAIEQLQAELREQAIRDPLTGLYNRRYLAETLERELARAARDEYPVSFVMIDIDLFKRINDTFGHRAGDSVLQKLATLLLSQTRIGDIVCRYGGEEILVVLPNVSHEIAYQITERWRLSFMGSTLPLKYGNTRATISCGISVYPLHGGIGNDLIALADEAMYRAKASGRNRVVTWDGFGSGGSNVG